MTGPEPFGTIARRVHHALILAALNPNPDEPAGDPMTQLRPGREPVDMSPEAVAQRRADVLHRLKEGVDKARARAARDRGELPFDEADR